MSIIVGILTIVSLFLGIILAFLKILNEIDPIDSSCKWVGERRSYLKGYDELEIRESARRSSIRRRRIHYDDDCYDDDDDYDYSYYDSFDDYDYSLRKKHRRKRHSAY